MPGAIDETGKWTNRLVKLAFCTTARTCRIQQDSF
jgi:hypothetical protein